MDDYSAMKATKRKKYSYEKDREYAEKHPRKKYSYEKDLERAAKKSMKNLGAVLAVALIFLIVGVLSGFFGFKYLFSKDYFSMTAYENGTIDISIGPNEDAKSYTELGAKCVSFGKDQSDKIVITYYYREDLTQEKQQVDEVDVTKPGMYYAVYTTSASRYKTITLIRNIYVSGVEDNG